MLVSRIFVHICAQNTEGALFFLFSTTVETKVLTAVRDIRPLGENISMSHQGELNEK